MSKRFIQCRGYGCDNEEAVLSQSKAGTYYITCHRCEFSTYSKPGTPCHDRITALLASETVEVLPKKIPVPEKQFFDLSKL